MWKRKLPTARSGVSSVSMGANLLRSSQITWRERLSAWRDQHFYSLFSSLGRLAARPWATLFTVLVMGLALALPLLFFLLLDNTRQLSGGLREAREATVFLKMDVNVQTAQHFAQELRNRGDVTAVILRTPDEGLVEFKQLAGVSDALEVLPHNPLPSVLVVTPLTQEGEDPKLIADLQLDQRVDLVQYDAAWRRRLSAILNLGERAVQVLAAVLALATLLVLGNTVRLDIQSRGEEIAVMQLIGAGKGFVRRPFLYAGFWYGLLGGLLAVLVALGVEFALATPVDGLAASYDYRFTLRGVSVSIALIIIMGSAGLGWLGAYLASSRHLIASQPQ